MPLWTPYAQDTPLDLSKGSAVRPSASLQLPELRFPLLPTVHSPNASPVREGVSPDSGLHLEVDSPPPVSEAASLFPSGRASSVPPHARPFKAATSALSSRVDLQCSPSAAPDPDYEAYRASVLEAMIVKNGGSLCVSNPRMRRAVRRSSDSPDAEYMQRRARNNAAAKRSRDLRRLKEDELAIRATYLERVNRDLRAELEATRLQLAHYQTATAYNY